MFPRTVARSVEGEHNPHVRETTAMLGPLAAILLHKPSAQYGYLAGREAYQDMLHYSPNFSGCMPLQQLHALMDDYLAMPRHRPRQFTRDLAPEWRAMFVLGWTESIMNETPLLKETLERRT